VTDDGGHPVVLISNRQTSPIDGDALRALARDTLRAEGVETGELSVSFVDEEEMAGLHLRFMGEEGPTDVLSFPQEVAGEEGIGPIEGGGSVVKLLGDVVIAPSVAARNRPEDPGDELRLLLVHGILHLLGYDHEQEAERAEMWARQERYSGVRVP